MKLNIGTLKTVFQPTKAIMVYSSDVGGKSLLVEHDAYVLDGQTRLGEGRMMSEEAVRNTVKTFTKALDAAPRVIHPRVLVDTPNLFAWWLPKGRRIQAFDIDWHKDAKGRDRLLNRRATLPHPALVFVQRRGNGHGSTRLFALKGNERPAGDTEVFLAPFLNLNNDGWICWGSTPLPDSPIHESFTTVEEAFFESTFSHLNQNAVVNVGKRTCYEFFADLCDNPPEEFPVEVLLPRGTLNKVIAECAGGH